MYATTWHMTALALAVPLDCSLRLWDAFLVEGSAAVLSATLALMATAEPRLRELRFEGILAHVKTVEGELEADAFAAAMARFPVSQTYVKSANMRK